MPNTSGILAKKRHVASGRNPRVVDLFAGCGGFSLGFHRAGMQPIGAVEQDPVASKTHGKNFFGIEFNDVSPHNIARDISDTEPLDFLESLNSRNGTAAAVDVLIGGPPCQAFARIGRAKLREIANCDKAHRNDERVNLYREFVRFVDALNPLAVVVENVPDMMNLGGRNVVGEMCDMLADVGYESRYALLNAVHYGVPQFRERVFIIAFHRSLGIIPAFPWPSHKVELPSGYLGSRSVALKPLKTNPCSRYVGVNGTTGNAKSAVTCREAISDLPAITSHLDSVASRGARRFETLVKYPKRKRLGAFAEKMRNWNGFGNEAGVYDHVIRYLPRDFETFRLMEVGSQYPEAHQVALKRFEYELKNCNGSAPLPDSAAYDFLMKQIVPPYDPAKFPNKWWKLVPSMPSKTLTAHISKDTYSHIHYDSRQARTISVREAARLQSFPDGFVFAGAMNAAFRQIGNAVPPLIAYAIAKQLKRQLRKACG